MLAIPGGIKGGNTDQSVERDDVHMHQCPTYDLTSHFEGAVAGKPLRRLSAHVGTISRRTTARRLRYAGTHDIELLRERICNIKHSTAYPETLTAMHA